MRATCHLIRIFVANLLHLCYDKGVTKFVTTVIFDAIFCYGFIRDLCREHATA